MSWKIIYQGLAGVFIFSTICFLFALLLSFLAHLLHAESDKRTEEVRRLLPGLDCGVCGFSSCSEYAYKIVHKKVEQDRCLPGNRELLRKKRIQNLKNDNSGMVAKIFCLASGQALEREYIFNGTDDCYTLFHYFSGDRHCKYGCMGRGDCQQVCPTNAVRRDSSGRIWIDATVCSGCGKCMSVCPTQVIHLVPLNGGHFVACSNHDEGSLVKQNCKWGCTGCRICERFSPVGSGRVCVENNLAKISYSNDAELQGASAKCPSHVIVPIKEQKAFIFSLNQKEQTRNKSV